MGPKRDQSMGLLSCIVILLHLYLLLLHIGNNRWIVFELFRKATLLNFIKSVLDNGCHRRLKKCRPALDGNICTYIIRPTRKIISSIIACMPDILLYQLLADELAVYLMVSANHRSLTYVKIIQSESTNPYLFYVTHSPSCLQVFFNRETNPLPHTI